MFVLKFSKTSSTGTPNGNTMNTAKKVVHGNMQLYTMQLMNGHAGKIEARQEVWL